MKSCFGRAAVLLLGTGTHSHMGDGCRTFRATHSICCRALLRAACPSCFSVAHPSKTTLVLASKQAEKVNQFCTDARHSTEVLLVLAEWNHRAQSNLRGNGRFPIGAALLHPSAPASLLPQTLSGTCPASQVTRIQRVLIAQGITAEAEGGWGQCPTVASNEESAKIKSRIVWI